MFLVITARLKSLRGQHGWLWALACLAGFVTLFLVPLTGLHPVWWALGTLCLEVYVVRTCVKEWKARTKVIRVNAGLRERAGVQ